jgi:hypothetical protein
VKKRRDEREREWFWSSLSFFSFSSTSMGGSTPSTSTSSPPSGSSSGVDPPSFPSKQAALDACADLHCERIRIEEDRRKEREKRIRAFVFFSFVHAASRRPPRLLSLILVPSPSQKPNAATLLGCFSRCTSPFKPCCKEEHDAFWACYREKRKTGGGEGSKKISVLPFPRSKAKPDP